MATETARAIEAILMVADQPVPPQLLAQLLELQLDQITGVLDELMASYEVEDRGFILTKIAGGYRFQSHPDLAPYVERFVLEGQTARLSAAALETLAIIAYKQPISRAQVAQVRGVNVDGVVKTLEQRGYITEIGRDPGPGNPSLFGTTDAFLEKLGLASLADLPPIAGFVPGPDVVEQLEQGLRAEIDAETAAYVADLAERADEAAAEEAGEPDDAAVDAAPVDVVDVGSVEVETIEVVDAVEVDVDGDVVEIIEVIDDAVAVTDDGEVVEVVDVVEETIVVTTDGDVIDIVDETVVVTVDGEVVEAVEVVTEAVVAADDVIVDTDPSAPDDVEGDPDAPPS
jgi:segregation and condensation protein B